MSLRDVTIARDETGDGVRVTSRTGSAWRFVENWKKVRELNTQYILYILQSPNEEDRLLELADARRTCALWGALKMGAKWIRQHRRLCLSSLRRNLELKVNKKVSYLNKKSLRVFEFRDSYVLYMFYRTLYVYFAHGVNCDYSTESNLFPFLLQQLVQRQEKDNSNPVVPISQLMGHMQPWRSIQVRIHPTF